ncbi:MAG: hypothetical protein KF814_17250 [Nitrospiraceae bacterium]|nr:hypothetical protein [Nitrospiraceae bacterium]
MNQTKPLLGLLGLLIAIEAGLQTIAPSSIESDTTRALLMGFLFGVPACLTGAVMWTGRRWAVMAIVMYGTIALALDLATLVQELSQSALRVPVVVLTAGSSLCCFLLMLLGGRAVLTIEDAGPGVDRRPNLRSPSSF